MKNNFTIIYMVFAISSMSVFGQTYTQSSGTVTKTSQIYGSTTADESAIKVTGGTLKLTTCAVTKSGAASNMDNSNFYGLNAAVLNYGSSAVLNMTGGTITTSGAGANAFYSYAGASTISDVTINCSASSSRGLYATGGGSITASNITATTAGANSSVIATDRGGGTITVTGGEFTANGNSSAAAYSTGTITCNNATLVSNGAEALVIEGSNNINLNNCTTEANYNKWGAMVYQSMSGDASGVDGYLTITDGTFKYKGTSGGMFYNTNSTAYITLKGVTLTNSCDTLVRCIKGSWGGSSASSGGITHLTGDGQTMSGLIHFDANSKGYITLQNSSVFTGAINNSNTASLVTLTMDAGSTWTLTANSHINGLITNPGITGTTVTNITGNGFNVYYTISTNSSLGGKTYTLVGGGYLLPEGTTSVNSSKEDITTLSLTQNSPNPVTTSTTISYYVPSTSSILLSVYNSTGLIVETIVNERQIEGNHTIAWTPQLPSGIYICILRSNGKLDSKRIVISK